MDPELEQRLRQSLTIQAEELMALARRLPEGVRPAIELIESIKGRVIFCGLGKSGLIARKVAATMSSTGTPALYLHPVESLHGDLGLVTRDDLVFFISKSGENPELNLMFPTLGKLGVPTLVLTANRESTLARKATLVLDFGPVREICPLSLAPTTSNTLCMVLLDAMAMELMRRRDFTERDYAMFHPGGELGRKLNFSVRDLMTPLAAAPVVAPEARLRAMLAVMTHGRMGAVLVARQDQLLGLITDNDVRRYLEKEEPRDLYDTCASALMNPTPSTCSPDDSAYEVLLHMRRRNPPVRLMPVARAGTLAGIITLEIMVQHGLV